MTEQELIELCSTGESTTLQYKLEFTTQRQIAEELVAFANTHGGTIIFGAEEIGELPQRMRILPKRQITIWSKLPKRAKQLPISR